MSALRAFAVSTVPLAAVVLTGLACGQLPLTSDPTASGTVYLWVSADKDALVSCGPASSNCSEQNLNYGTYGFLAVANNGVGLKKSYVHFTPPTFPAGTEILEAYVELFHGGQNEDGQTDDVLIPVAHALAAWDPNTLTWANQPNTQLVGEFTTVNLTSQDWSGTPDVAPLVQDWHDQPATNYGLVLYWNQQSLGIEKGFSSNNHTSRTQTELGQAPRLLIKIQLPDGTTTDDMTLGFLPPDHDLGNLPQPLTTVRFQSGDDWPAEWGVRKGL